jgi:hypothetical protein
MEQVVDIYRAQPKKLAEGRAAVVAGKEFRLSPLFKIFTSRHGFRLIVFSDLTLACKWLGLDTKDAQRYISRLRTKLVGETRVGQLLEAPCAPPDLAESASVEDCPRQPFPFMRRQSSMSSIR